MARPKNTLETVQITISTTAQVKQALETLAETGFFGKNAAETAHQILVDRLRDLLTSPLPGFDGWNDQKGS